MVQQINENMIREAAYFLWEKAGRPDGSAEFFWMKACEQFFKPAKVAIKKPVKKAEKKGTTVKKTAPAKPVVAKVSKPAPKAAVKAVKAAPKATAKPATKQAKKVSAPVFYGARK
ncbi:MAG: DUF2934 domain-containing protein [Alphaproteobacteria bacterium]